MCGDGDGNYGSCDREIGFKIVGMGVALDCEVTIRLLAGEDGCWVLGAGMIRERHERKRGSKR